MNKVLILCCFTIFLFACKKDKDNYEKKVVDKITKTIETKYSYDINYYNYESIPIAYLGDTIEFSISFKSNILLSHIRVYFSNSNGKRYEAYPNISGSNLETSFIKLNKFEGTIKYVYPLNSDRFNYIYNFNYYYQEPFFIFDYCDSTGIVKSDTLPRFNLRTLEVFNNKRLYNIANKQNGYARGFRFYVNDLQGYDFGYNVNCGGSCLLTNDTSLFMVNTPNNDYDVKTDIAVNKNFIEGWNAPKNNHYFVKVTKDLDYNGTSYLSKVKFADISTPKQLKDIYQQNSPKTNKVENIKVGDLYAFIYIKASPHGSSISDTYDSDVYGLIEITHIENDKLTSDNGGNDLDYIEFRLKSFGMSQRFK